jgi:hypothetical protein
MTEYNFEAYDPNDKSTTTKQFDSASLDTILKEFQYFLKGVGFEFDGNIGIVQEDNYDVSFTTDGFADFFPSFGNKLAD